MMNSSLRPLLRYLLKLLCFYDSHHVSEKDGKEFKVTNLVKRKNMIDYVKTSNVVVVSYHLTENVDEQVVSYFLTVTLFKNKLSE